MDRIDAMRAFVRLAELQSFTAVAQELRVRQSTVSKWLAALEEELGVSLVERTTRTQRLTPAGELFYGRAQHLVGAFEEVCSELQGGAPQLTGRARISLPVVFGPQFVVPVLANLFHEHPDLEVDLIFSDRYVHLIEDRIDLAVRVGDPVDSTFRSRTVGRSERWLVAAPSYLDAHPGVRRPEDLRNHEVLSHNERQRGTSWRFTKGSAEASVFVRGRLAGNHSGGILELVRAGHGIALLASWLVGPAVASGELLRLLPHWRAPLATIQVLTAPGKFDRPLARHIAERLGSAFEGAPFDAR